MFVFWSCCGCVRMREGEVLGVEFKLLLGFVGRGQERSRCHEPASTSCRSRMACDTERVNNLSDGPLETSAETTKASHWLVPFREFNERGLLRILSDRSGPIMRTVTKMHEVRKIQRHSINSLHHSYCKVKSVSPARLLPFVTCDLSCHDGNACLLFRLRPGTSMYHQCHQYTVR
jgi:hypothetical protein